MCLREREREKRRGSERECCMYIPALLPCSQPTRGSITARVVVTDSTVIIEVNTTVTFLSVAINEPILTEIIRVSKTAITSWWGEGERAWDTKDNIRNVYTHVHVYMWQLHVYVQVYMPSGYLLLIAATSIRFK